MCPELLGVALHVILQLSCIEMQVRGGKGAVGLLMVGKQVVVRKCRSIAR